MRQPGCKPGRRRADFRTEGSKPTHGKGNRVLHPEPLSEKSGVSSLSPCPRFRLAFWMKTFNMGAIYQLCWTILRTAFSAPGATPFPRGVKRRIAIKPESGVRSDVSYPESAMHPRCVASRRSAQVENWLPAKISGALLLPNRSCPSAYYDPFLAQPRDRLLPNPDTYLRSPCALSFPAIHELFF